MPTYDYACSNCGADFDIIKAIAELNRQENCPSCRSEKTDRRISRTHFYGASDWDKSEYNPGLGIVTKNSKHRDREAKARGLIEVGNEDVAKVMADQESRAREIEAERDKETYEPIEYALKKAQGKI